MLPHLLLSRNISLPLSPWQKDWPHCLALIKTGEKNIDRTWELLPQHFCLKRKTPVPHFVPSHYFLLAESLILLHNVKEVVMLTLSPAFCKCLNIYLTSLPITDAELWEQQNSLSTCFPIWSQNIYQTR